MKTFIKRKWIVTAIIFITLIAMQFYFKNSFGNQNTEDENIVISTMSVYKNMDYSFLKTYNFGGTNSSNSVLTFDTVESLTTSEDIRLKKNKYVTTKGYYEIRDLGGATYLISDKADAYGSLKLQNGLYANIVPDSYIDKDGTKWVVVSVKQCGAKGDGKNEDQIGINSALNVVNNYANSNNYDRGLLYMPKGEYKAYNQIQANVKNVNFVGDGDESIIFTDNDYRKDFAYDEPFFASWNGNNNFFGFFKLDAREVNLRKYMRQMCLFYCENMYIYNVTYYIPQEAWTGSFFEDKQYTNLTIYSGNKVVTVDNCLMYQMSGTYRGANIGIMDFWQTGTENITIMNCELHDNARDEQVGIFSVSGKPKSYIKNVDFINNTIYTYTTPYKEIHGWRTMCFTIGYGDNQVDDINISNNHFISETDSKFMTFGSVTNCRLKNNIFEIISSNGNVGYVFDSSAPDSSNVLIDNNEFFLTYKNSSSEGKTFSSGNLTFTNNRLVSDCIIGKVSDRLGIYDNNKFVALNGFTSFGSATRFTNSRLDAYAGHNGFYSDIFFTISDKNENADIVYTGNTINDYTYFYDYKYVKPFDKLSSINNATLNSLNFSNNIYNCPNYSFIDNSYIYITWYRDSNVKDFICKNNDFQGAKGMLNYEFDENLNTFRDFTYDPTIPRISSIDITYNGEKVTELTTTENIITLDKIIRIAKENNEEEVANRDIDWITAIESIASVSNNGVVTRKKYGSVYIYATSKDGSKVYSKVKINFVKAKAQDIKLEKNELILKPNQKYNAVYEVIPYNSVSQNLKWESSNENVAKVNNNGTITAVAVGQATITLTTTDGTNISKKINVIVKPTVVTKIELNSSYDYYENIGQTKQLEVVSYFPNDAINKSIGKWVSSNEKIAKVNSNGYVTIVGRGVCTIYAYSTDESCYSYYNIYVKPNAVQNFTVSTTKTQAILKWDTMDNVYGYNIYRYCDSEKTWTKIASKISVNDTSYTDSNLTPNTEYKYYMVGFISSWDTGTRIEYEGISSNICTVKTNTSETITSITAGTTHLSMTIGNEGEVGVNYFPKNAEYEELNWEIADTSIANIKEIYNKTKAKFIGLKEGFTTLTISSKDHFGVSTTIPVGVVPHYKIKDFELSSNYNNVEVKWKSIEEENKIDGYIISRTKSIEFSPIAYIPLDKLAKSKYSDGEDCYMYLDTGLLFGESYRYVITPYIMHDGFIYPCYRSMDRRVGINSYVPVESIVAENEYILNLNEEKEIFVKTDTQNASKEDFIWYSKNNDIVSVRKTSEKSAVLKGLSTGISIIEIIANDEDCNYISPKVVVLPDSVSQFKAVADKQKVMLSWNSVKGATGYNIYKYDSQLSEWKLLSSTANCKYEDISVECNKNYLYKISAYIADAEKSYEGKVSDEMIVTTPDNPSYKLISIGNIDSIKEVANGTALSVEALGLPQIISVKIENSAITSAKIVWNLETLADGTHYDVNCLEKQTFSILGKVILPIEVDLNNIATEVKIKIIVMESNNSNIVDSTDETKKDETKPDDSTNMPSGDKTNPNDSTNIPSGDKANPNDSTNIPSGDKKDNLENNSSQGNTESDNLNNKKNETTNIKDNSNFNDISKIDNTIAISTLPKTGTSTNAIIIVCAIILTIISAFYCFIRYRKIK